VTTIYEVVEDKDGTVYALPDYQFTYGNTTAYKGPSTASCVPKAGSIPDSNVAVPWTHGYTYAPGGDNSCALPGCNVTLKQHSSLACYYV
jgi:hypothetical protein